MRSSNDIWSHDLLSSEWRLPSSSEVIEIIHLTTFLPWFWIFHAQSCSVFLQQCSAAMATWTTRKLSYRSSTRHLRRGDAPRTYHWRFWHHVFRSETMDPLDVADDDTPRADVFQACFKDCKQHLLWIFIYIWQLQTSDLNIDVNCPLNTGSHYLCPIATGSVVSIGSSWCCARLGSKSKFGWLGRVKNSSSSKANWVEGVRTGPNGDLGLMVIFRGDLAFTAVVASCILSNTLGAT